MRAFRIHFEVFAYSEPNTELLGNLLSLAATAGIAIGHQRVARSKDPHRFRPPSKVVRGLGGHRDPLRIPMDPTPGIDAAVRHATTCCVIWAQARRQDLTPLQLAMIIAATYAGDGAVIVDRTSDIAYEEDDFHCLADSINDEVSTFAARDAIVVDSLEGPNGVSLWTRGMGKFGHDFLLEGVAPGAVDAVTWFLYDHLGQYAATRAAIKAGQNFVYQSAQDGALHFQPSDGGYLRATDCDRQRAPLADLRRLSSLVPAAYDEWMGQMDAEDDVPTDLRTGPRRREGSSRRMAG
jgi:hypothetical protein